MEKKNLFWLSVIGIIILAIICALLNYILPKEQYMTYGTLISEEVYFDNSFSKGTVPKKFYHFKLDNGNTARIPAPIRRTNIPKGTRAEIYYRKGVFFKNPIYDYYKFNKSISTSSS